MNDEFNPKNTADEWEMSQPEMLQTKKDSAIQNSTEDLVKPPQNFSQPQAETAEDWGMTKPLKPLPNAAIQKGWELPEPKFRCSDGVVPKKFVKAFPADKDEPKDGKPADFFEKNEAPPIPSEPAINQVSKLPEAAKPAPPNLPIVQKTIDIEPQPDIANAFAVAPSIVAPTPLTKPKNKILRIFLTISGVLLMLAVAVVFLILVYYLFFHKTA